MDIKGLSAVAFENEAVGEALEIVAVEAGLAVELPAALVDVIAGFEGPVRFEAEVGLVPQQLPQGVTGEAVEVDLIFGRNAGRFGLVEVNRAYADRIDPVFRAIADAGAGDLYLWNTRSGEVVFWRHDTAFGEGSPEALTTVAPSVDAFLDALTLLETPPVAAPKGLVSVQLDF